MSGRRLAPAHVIADERARDRVRVGRLDD